MKTENTKIEVGSRAFFGGFADFASKDHDYVVLVDKPQGFNYRRECSLRGVDTFEYKRMSAADFVAKTLEYADALAVGKFLVKGFADAIGLTTDQLQQLQPLVEKLDEKHQYERIIFDAIISAGSWDLSDETLQAAYALYTESRKAKEAEKPTEPTDTQTTEGAE
jgi:hypothetical protein